MEMTNDCLPCIVRGSLDAARLASDDEEVHRTIARRVMAELLRFDMNQPPPMMALVIQRVVTEITGVEDPYYWIKKKYNDFALTLLPKLKKKYAPISFDTAVRLCIAGNIIDYGTHTRIGEKKVLQTIDQTLKMDINGNAAILEAKCRQAKKILWIGDNAGEIVFDTLMLEILEPGRVIYAVRGGPTQNDATLEDSECTGLDRFVRVIDTGAAIPGIVLSHCSKEFKQAYNQADLIIAKGQGNLETLDRRDSRVFFLFKAKCPVVARYAGCSLGDTVILKGGGQNKDGLHQAVKISESRK